MSESNGNGAIFDNEERGDVQKRFGMDGLLATGCLSSDARMGEIISTGARPRQVSAEVSVNLAASGRTGIMCAEIQPQEQNKEDVSMAIDGKKLTKGQIRKLNALRKSIGNELGEEVFGKWLAQVSRAAAGPKPDPVAVRIEEALSDFATDRTFKLGNYGYTIRRARGKGASGFAATKNEKPVR